MRKIQVAASKNKLKISQLLEEIIKDEIVEDFLEEVIKDIKGL
ncbi:MAG: hypothetical protein QW589_01035 [Candidatus Bathyarchaeia archaeon]